jgi:beta-lactamase regulating signal transducer with metallopeptidase domain
MLIYLLKSGACLAILLLFYKVVLERESMHHFKRYYLLAALALSLVIPTIVFTEYVEIVPNRIYEQAQISNPVVEDTILEPVTKEGPVNWEMILWFVYGFGVLGFGFRFIKHLAQIWFRIRKNPKLKNNFITRVLLAQQLPPHTFFSYIFLNKKQFESQNIPQEVLLHEETHAKQKHSIDILLIELTQVFLWFNPLIYVVKSSIKLNHEFLADNAVVKKNNNHYQYQNTILSYLSNDNFNKHQSTGIANAINYSSIKKRFTVMKTNTSKKSIVLRSILLIPLMTLLLFGFSTSKEVYIPNHKLSETTEQYARSLRIEILGNGDYLVEEVLVNRENLVAITNQFNTDIDTDIRNKILNIHLTSLMDIPNSEVWFLYNSLLDYGFYRIVTPNQEIIKKKGNTPFANESNYPTRLELEKYNALATKHNTVPIEKRKIPLNELKTLESIYAKMSKPQKSEAQPFPECLPQNQKTVDLIEINVNNKGQLFVLDERVRLEDLKSYLSKINKHLSFAERKKVIRSIIKVDTKTPKEIIQKADKILTEYGSATINIIGPEYNSKSQQQKSATRIEMKEYNGLAKKYNEMDRNHMRIKMQDVQRLKTIYAKMSTKQREDAEPFPDFPEPPPTPDAPEPPKNISNMDYATNQIGTIIEEQDPYDVVGGGIKANHPPLVDQPLAPKYVKDVEPTSPPPPPEPISPVENIEKLAKEGADFMLNGQKISAKKALEVVKNNNRLNIDLRESNGEKPLIKISVDPIHLKN